MGALALWVVAFLCGFITTTEKHSQHTSVDAADEIRLDAIEGLFNRKDFMHVLVECAEFETSSSTSRLLPEIWYVKWITLRELQRVPESDRVKDLFLERFPDHVLGADMHFTASLEALHRADYEQTLKGLDVITSQFPDSRSARRAAALAVRIKDFLHTSTTRPMNR